MKSRHLALALSLLLFAACSAEGDPTTTAGPSTTVAPSTTAPSDSTTTPPSAGATITISGFSFGDPLTVAVGEEVTVVNRDGVPHTWTSNDGLFDSGSLSGGEEFAFTFDEAGQYSFFCGVHPQMTGTITVES